MISDDKYTINDDDIDSINSEQFHDVCQFGFIITNGRNESCDWGDWDGKIGGKPIWLDPLNLPNSKELLCNNCSTPTTFLLQVYCPLDDLHDAFHRCLYVFVCRNGECLDKGGLIVLRCQVCKNDFNSISSLTNVCIVCGCKSSSVCSKCKNTNYCSKNHQILHWPYHKSSCNKLNDNTSDNNIFNALFPEFFVEVEEDLPDIIDDESIVNNANFWEGANTELADEDNNINQADYNKALGTERSDPVYESFLNLIRSKGEGLVLIYSRWIDNNSRVCSNKNEKLASFDIPNCEFCGSCRKIELQISPQILFYLKVDNNSVNHGINKTLDWSLLDIYTCSACCSYKPLTNGISYVKEYGKSQKPVNFEYQRWS